MIKNIIIYLLLLISAFVFNIFYFAWFSWFLLVLTISVPFVSLAVSLPFMLTSISNGFLVFSYDKISRAEEFYIGVTGKKGRSVFCPRLRIKLNAENSFINKNEKLKIEYAGTLKKPYYSKHNKLSKHCGCVNLTAKYAKVYDMTGIFFIPVRIDCNITCDIMPRAKKPSVLPDNSKISILGYKPKNGGFSDYYELREYRAGDSLKNIHWKLSSKYDDLIVREPSTPIYRQFYIKLHFGENLDANDDILARFVYACKHIIKSGMPCCVVCGDGEVSVISGEKELNRFISALYRGQQFNNRNSESSNVLVYSIYEDGEEVDEA